MRHNWVNKIFDEVQKHRPLCAHYLPMFEIILWPTAWAKYKDINLGGTTWVGGDHVYNCLLHNSCRGLYILLTSDWFSSMFQ